MGYGFVKFRNHVHAKNAMNNLDGLMLQHKKIKVSFARPANEPIKTANVYVSGLKNTITEAELISVFSKYGKVLTVKVMNNDGDPKRATAIGFVRFEKHQCAETAIANLDQTRPLGNPSPIHVSFAKQSKDGSNNYGVVNSVVNPVPYPGGYGNTGILNNVVPKPILPFPGSKFPNNVGKSPTFTGKNMRFDPLGKNNPAGFRTNLADGMFPINEGMYAASPDVKGYVIFVFNLAPEVEEVHLWRLFGPFGAITDIKIVYDKETKKSRGFAFVTMPNYREAEVAIRSLDQTVFEGKILQVSFKKERNQN